MEMLRLSHPLDLFSVDETLQPLAASPSPDVAAPQSGPGLRFEPLSRTITIKTAAANIGIELLRSPEADANGGASLISVHPALVPYSRIEAIERKFRNGTSLAKACKELVLTLVWGDQGTDGEVRSYLPQRITIGTDSDLIKGSGSQYSVTIPGILEMTLVLMPEFARRVAA